MNTSQGGIGSASVLTTRNAPARSSASLGFRILSQRWMLLSMALIGGFLLAPGVKAAQVDELNSAIDNLGTVADQSAAAETTAERLLNETNATETALLIAPVLDAQIGAPIDVPLTLVPGPGGNTAIQFDLSLPEGLSIISVTAGPAATAIGKSVTFSTTTNSTILFGLNQTKLVEGVVAIAHLQVSMSAKAGLYPFEMINPVASDGNGKLSPLSLTSGTLRVK